MGLRRGQAPFQICEEKEKIKVNTQSSSFSGGHEQQSLEGFPPGVLGAKPSYKPPKKMNQQQQKKKKKKKKKKKRALAGNASSLAVW